MTDRSPTEHGMPETAAEPVLRMTGITKRFPGVLALSEVDFEVRPGEIHALLGQNGAGKSTLVKVLTGVYRRDEGTVRLNGLEIDPHAPREAEALGVSTVYQEVNLIPHLSVAENILLGRQPGRFGFVHWRRTRERGRTALGRLGLDIDVTRELASYSVAVQQMVALARALDLEARLLVLDEPTSSLDEKETGELFEVMRTLKRRGLALVFITHFLEEVFEIADRITVLRNGRRVDTRPTPDMPRLELVATMLGKEQEEIAHAGTEDKGEPASAGDVFLEANALGSRNRVGPVSLDVRSGEVVGLAGLLGSGRTETARMLFGIDRVERGELRLRGKPVSLRSPRQAIDLGIGFCSEDRKIGGIVPHLSVRENLLLARQARQGALRRLRAREQNEIVSHYIRALDIRTPSPETPVRNLSGGNQQKVLLARWLAMQPELIILDEPTRGIDVGAKVEVERLVQDLRQRGMAILFISAELEEVARDCGRVVVLRDRRSVGELTGAGVTVRKIMQIIAHSTDEHD